MRSPVKDANQAWIDLLSKVASSPTVVSPRGLACRELLGNQTIVDMTRPVVTVKERKLGRRFMVAEAWWICSGRNDVASIAPYSRDIGKFSDDGIRFDGSYGPPLIDQMRYVRDSLIKDNDTRQAVASIWRHNPRPSKDVSCTLSLQWVIRKDAKGVRKLHCLDTMRSSDCWLGVVYDWFNMSMISAGILLDLWAEDQTLRDVGLGDLTLTAGSQHVYESNFDAVERVFKDPTADEYEPIRLEDFESSSDLLHHLSALKDRGKTLHHWLTDLGLGDFVADFSKMELGA